MDDLVSHWVRKLKEAQAVSEYHFRDAVEDLIEECSRRDFGRLFDDES